MGANALLCVAWSAHRVAVGRSLRPATDAGQVARSRQAIKRRVSGVLGVVGFSDFWPTGGGASGPSGVKASLMSLVTGAWRPPLICTVTSTGWQRWDSSALSGYRRCLSYGSLHRVAMDLSKLMKPDLVMLCEEMGIEVATLRRKPLLIQALEDSGADEEELSECWELIQERLKRESEDKERETVRRKEEEEIQIREIERLRLQLQIVEAKCASSVREENAEIQADARLSMRDLLQPYKMSEDIALFLVNFERTCARVGFDRATWPQKLLTTVLPCEEADTLARLPETDADDYNKIKAALLKKFRLSAEAFSRRFRDAQKTTSETFQEFAFNMKADLVEWLKGEGVYEDRDKVVDLICLEQFYGSIDEEMRLWIQDRPGERNIERAAELADEYTVRRQSEKARVRPFSKQPLKDLPERKGPIAVKKAPENEAKENSEKERKFESKKTRLCFRCQEPGHIAAGCRKPKLVFSVMGGGDENMQLLRPYLRDLVVNGKDCKVLRDSGATMDIVHPDYVEATHLTGECAWIRQVAEKNSICLPIAKVTIEGPFGVLGLRRQYLRIYRNIQAITRSKARELAAQRAGEGEKPRAVDPCEQASTSAGEDGNSDEDPESQKCRQEQGSATESRTNSYASGEHVEYDRHGLDQGTGSYKQRSSKAR
ncbi:hypothetical protein HPB50_017573 [Hyalomma asiaticum]|uniref:Uncharacterized protein n=1 Tax=Hyalomma asiaticum TaxID=266040 RepID=A0ACB7RLW9_HYAAI|nr:hypothetical protein HPB50_017573 [Hyalomma asiaticum]